MEVGKLKLIFACCSFSGCVNALALQECDITDCTVPRQDFSQHINLYIYNDNKGSFTSRAFVLAMSMLVKYVYTNSSDMS